MNSRHINDSFHAFAPNPAQSNKMLSTIRYNSAAKQKAFRFPKLKRTIAIACSFVLLFSLCFGLFPILQKNDNGGVKIAFSGLTVTAYAANSDNNVITLDIELFEIFNRVEISVSAGSVSKHIDEVKGSRTITISENATLYWHSDNAESTVLSFEAFDIDNLLVSSGEISLNTGEIKAIKSYPIDE